MRTLPFVLAAIACIRPSDAFGQFSTVINVPPSTAPNRIGNNTQLNLYDGGFIAPDFWVGNQFSSSNVELNVFGGLLSRSARIGPGSVVNISGGMVGPYFAAMAGSAVRMSGGLFVDGATFEFGSNLTLVGSEFRVDGQPLDGIDASAGVVPVSLPLGSVISGTLADGRTFIFQKHTAGGLNGSVNVQYSPVPPPGPSVINVPGDAEPLGLRQGQHLTVRDGGFVNTNLNAAPDSVIDVLPGGSLVLQKFVGATVNVSGGELGGGSAAYTGSVVNLSSGRIGGFFGAYHNSTINMTGGRIGPQSWLLGARLNMSGGVLEDRFEIHAGGVAEIFGGIIADRVNVRKGGLLRLSGGDHYGQLLLENGAAELSGGSISNVIVLENSTAGVSGGVIRDRFVVEAGGHATLMGAEFRLNGQPLPGLEAAGDSRIVDVPDGSVISGVLADGTPFLFSSSDYESRLWPTYQDAIAGGTLRLKVAPPPVVSPGNFTTSIDGAQPYIRRGQTLNVDDPGVVGDHFRAGEGSVINVLAGGSIGRNFEAIGAKVNINGGTISHAFDASSGAVVDLTSGVIGGAMDVMNRGVVNVNGGRVEGSAYVLDGGLININGGTVGSGLTVHTGGKASMRAGHVDKLTVHQGGVLDVDGGQIAGTVSLFDGRVDVRGGIVSEMTMQGGQLTFAGGRLDNLTVGKNSAAEMSGGTAAAVAVQSGGVLKISGGVNRRLTALSGSEVTVAGGAIAGKFEARAGSSVSLAGGDFRLNGDPLPGLPQPGDSVILPSLDYDSVLSGVLQDGSPFAISPRDIDLVAPSTLRLKIAELPPIGPPLIRASVDPLPHGIRTGQTLLVDAGGQVGAGFQAHIGSTVNVMSGAVVGENFEATGATVNISGGAIGDDFDAFHGSEVNISGGRIGSRFELHPGAALNFAGGRFPLETNLFQNAEVIVHRNGRFNMSGGAIGDVDINEGGQAAFTGGRIWGRLYANYQTEINVAGGVFEDELSIFGGRTRITGGKFKGPIKIFGQEVHIFVTKAALDGDPIDLEIGQSVVIDAREVTLTGRLAEGPAFDFDLIFEGFDLTRDYLSLFAKLTVTRVMHPGDYDGNLLVDDADYAVWSAAAASGNLAADGNYDGQIDGSDLDVWRSRLGRSYMAVPEPATLALAFIAAMSMRVWAAFNRGA